ncbi:MAG: caspase family protein [Planctomycetota bacterium]
MPRLSLRRPRQARSIRRRSQAAFQAVGLTVTTAALLSACANPNMRVQPEYRGPDTLSSSPSADASDAARDTAIAIRVTDARRHKGPESSRGGEIVAKGDKGQIAVEQGVADYIAENLAVAYRAAGFEVRDDASVTVDVKVRDLRVEALEFTHWGLPSDRASTVDAIGLFLPGPDRPARALAVLDVDLAKNGQALGLSYYIEGYARNDVDNQAEVADTITQSWSEAVNRVVADTAAGLPLIAEYAVTQAEQEALQAQLDAQQARLEQAQESLAERERLFAADREALQATRRDIEQERKQLAENRQAVDQENQDAVAKLQAVQAELDQALAEVASSDAELAELTQNMQALQAEWDGIEAEQLALRTQAAAAEREQRAELSAQIDALTAERDALQTQLREAETKFSQGLENNAQAADLGVKLQALSAQRAELVVIRADLTTRSAELDGLETTLSQQSENVSAQLAELDARRTLLAEREQKLGEVETSIAQRDQELQEWSDQLAAWKLSLANAEKQAQARDEAFRAEQESLAQSEADLETRQAELARLEAERYAADRSIQTPKVDAKSNLKPQIYLALPDNPAPSTAESQLKIDGAVWDDGAITSLRFYVNDTEVDPATHKAGLVRTRLSTTPDPELTPAADSDTGLPARGTRGVREFEFVAPLTKYGKNDVRIVATDDQGASSTLDFAVIRRDPAGKVHVLSIGVEKYEGIPPLRFAVDDAEAVVDTLDDGLGITGNLITLYDEQATRREIVSAMTRGLRGLSKDDTVVIFFSGHGAPLAVPNPGGGPNVARYLLPVDAEADDLEATAINMDEIARYLNRIGAGRIIFLADTCYSGGVANTPGGRTVGNGVQLRAGFVPRSVPDDLADVVSGTGKVIMTASRDDQVAQELQELGHGVFSYYLIQGLNGEADRTRLGNGDGEVTIAELYDYVLDQVGRKTNNAQTPQINDDSAEGDIVISRIR